MKKFSRISELETKVADGQNVLPNESTTRVDKAYVEKLKKEARSLEEDIAIQQQVLNDYEAFEKERQCLR